tara:strand:- start:18689 stop:20836 length:2148 start_codon:yes stop_codon:yes gene_type:complete
MAKISTYSVVAPKAKDKIIISESSGTPINVTKNVTVAGLQAFINDVPAPTLQDVTTSGNTTTKNITTQGIKSEGTRDTDLSVKIGDYDGLSGGTKLTVDIPARTVSVEANILKLKKLGGTTTNITFDPTISRSIVIPDASGTIALTSDLPSASPWNSELGSGINYQAGNVGIGTTSGGDALTVNGQINSTAIETSGILVEGNATIDDALSAGTVSATSVTATTLAGKLVGTVDTTTTGVTQPSTTDNNLLATTAFVQDLLGDVVSGLQFQDTWDASTDTPDLSTATPNNGDFWIVKIAGTTDLSGITAWAVGDWAIYIVPSGGGGSFWQKIDNATSLTGQGTGNQVAKWSGAGLSDALTNSIITDTGTAVGINVLAPVAALEVGGEIIAQSLDIQAGALVQGNLTVDNGAGVTGALSAGSLAVGGNAAVTGNFEVLGDSNFQEVITTALSCTGFDSSALANLDGGFTSGTSGTINGELTVTDEVFLQDNLNVTGDIFLTSDLQNKISTDLSSKIKIIGDTAVSLESSDGLDFSVSDTFDFKGQTAINVFNGGTLSASLDVSQITTSRSFQFPDNSGTVALLSDIPATTEPLEWVGQISQSSTSAPVIAKTQTSTLFVGDRVTTPTAFRDITFSRNAVGTYRLAVNWTQSTVPTDATKLSIMFGDNVARVYTFTLGSINGVNYKEFLFRTYTPAGVEADDQLLGINGAMTSVILYP